MRKLGLDDNNHICEAECWRLARTSKIAWYRLGKRTGFGADIRRQRLRLRSSTWPAWLE